MTSDRRRSSPITGLTNKQKRNRAIATAVSAVGLVVCFINLLIGGLLIGFGIFLLVKAGGDNASCPNCAADLRVVYKSMTCDDCKHRLVARDGRLIDVT
jgi:hypothetical protein